MANNNAADTGPMAQFEETLPRSYYFSPDIFSLESQHIFHREWVCVCREEQLSSATNSLALDILGESVLLLRDKDGVLRAFHNVCRHRGAKLCRADNTDADKPTLLRGGALPNHKVMCPYHSWTYDFSGHLIAAPHLAADSYDKSAFSLHQIRLATWGGFVFLNFSPEPTASLANQLGNVMSRTARYPLAELRIGQTIRYRVQANWKVVLENYNECYHCAGVHPELCAVVPAFRNGGVSLDWDSGIPHRPGAYTFTKTGTTLRQPFPGLDENERTRHKGELIYPNLMLSLACDHVAAFTVHPVDPGTTEVICQFLFDATALADENRDLNDAVDFWDLVNRQDWEVCERVQAGMRSSAYQSGYYAPMEDVNLDMRRYISDRIGTHAQCGATGDNLAPSHSA